MLEDIEMTIERLVFIEFGYKKSTSFFDMDETIIRETELDTLTFEDDLFGIYDESGLSSKKRKRDINICGCDSSVSVVWKKNVAGFFFRVVIVVNESLLNKPI